MEGNLEPTEVNEALSNSYGNWYGYNGDGKFGKWANLNFDDHRDAIFAKMRWPDLVIFDETERGNDADWEGWNVYK